MSSSLTRIFGLAMFIVYSFIAGAWIHHKYFSIEAQHRYIQQMYSKLLAQTGQGGMVGPLTIHPGRSVNAYASNDGSITVYQGMIDEIGDGDALAMVLGHEIAHITLRHLDMSERTRADIELTESHADKMGAFYMMRAGYDICEGRKVWKMFLNKQGDYLNGTHPGYAYRYEQLNVQCEK